MPNLKITLDPASIDSAIAEIRNISTTIVRGCERIREIMAERIADLARTKYASSILDDTYKTLSGSGGSRSESSTSAIMPSNIQVNWQASGGNVTMVIVSGEEAIWIEFGAGVYHNGSVGSKPNPYANSLTDIVGIGQYGTLHGQHNTWAFYKDGVTYLTHGTPASRPLYESVQEVVADFPAIVRSVFPNARF